MKDLKFSQLLDIYGELLTDKQQSFLKQYYNLDCSLSEIAESSGVSRQAVLGTIRKGEKAMLNFEDKLGLLKKGEK